MQYDQFFGINSYQIHVWSYHVTQAENVSFSYFKSYPPLNIGTIRTILWFYWIPNGGYK